MTSVQCCSLPCLIRPGQDLSFVWVNKQTSLSRSIPVHRTFPLAVVLQDLFERAEEVHHVSGQRALDELLRQHAAQVRLDVAGDARLVRITANTNSQSFSCWSGPFTDTRVVSDSRRFYESYLSAKEKRRSNEPGQTGRQAQIKNRNEMCFF